MKIENQTFKDKAEERVAEIEKLVTRATSNVQVNSLCTYVCMCVCVFVWGAGVCKPLVLCRFW